MKDLLADWHRIKQSSRHDKRQRAKDDAFSPSCRPLVVDVIPDRTEHGVNCGCMPSNAEPNDFEKFIIGVENYE